MTWMCIAPLLTADIEEKPHPTLHNHATRAGGCRLRPPHRSNVLSILSPFPRLRTPQIATVRELEALVSVVADVAG